MDSYMIESSKKIRRINSKPAAEIATAQITVDVYINRDHNRRDHRRFTSRFNTRIKNLHQRRSTVDMY